MCIRDSLTTAPPGKPWEAVKNRTKPDALCVHPSSVLTESLVRGAEREGGEEREREREREKERRREGGSCLPSGLWWAEPELKVILQEIRRNLGGRLESHREENGGYEAIS